MNNITIGIIALIVGIIGTVLVTGKDSGEPVATTDTVIEVSAISADNPFESIPVIDAYYEGEILWFIHTDVSDEEMAKRLTNMVDYNTVYSSKLSQIDSSNLGKIYVFTNGIKQDGVEPWEGGPFGYQIDILDSIPGDLEYTPIRNPYTVTWNEDATPRILTSMDELKEAEQNGELVTKATNIVVNVPVVKWPSDYLGGESKI